VLFEYYLILAFLRSSCYWKFSYT